MGKSKYKRRGKGFFYTVQICLRCEKKFRARGRMIEGKPRLIRRICKKCRVLILEYYDEESGGPE